jgi:hypothetical protein
MHVNYEVNNQNFRTSHINTRAHARTHISKCSSSKPFSNERFEITAVSYTFHTGFLLRFIAN